MFGERQTLDSRRRARSVVMVTAVLKEDARRPHSKTKTPNTQVVPPKNA